MIEKKERRRAPRTVLSSAFMDISDEEARTRGRICDISPLGVGFISDKEFVKDSMVRVELLLPNFRSLIDAYGRIVWCSEKRGEGYQAGVEFRKDYYKGALIRDYIKVMKLRENLHRGNS